ncbi:MAG: glutamine-hydrolyzing GMP synthase [Microgenomates group bacterium]
MTTPTEAKREPNPEKLHPHKRICAILDTGAQYGKVVDRRVREDAVETVILPLSTPWEQLKEYGAIILPGGPDDVTKNDAVLCDPRIFTEEHDVPVLGICLGMHLMTQALGGKLERLPTREDGQATITMDGNSPLMNGLENYQEVLLTHGVSVTKPAPDFKVTAHSEDIIAAVEHTKRKFFGVQFHPEVDLTVHGKEMIHNFLYDVAGFEGDFTIEDREEAAIKAIREQVGTSPVSLLVSGGVDSTVLAALLAKALPPEQIHAFHFDNGFMRKDESKKVKEALEKIGLNLEVIDASNDFYNAIGNSIDPEFKRKTIGDVFLTKARQLMIDRGFNSDEVFFAQGTLRPDLIESASSAASSKADGIKTHHNDSPLAREFRAAGRLVEPLQELHKDEVRELGAKLGLPTEIVWRQPFPGPGLAIRIIGSDHVYGVPNPHTLNQLRLFTTSDIQATLLPVKTVGVQGDERSYKHTVALSGDQNWEELKKLALAIPRKVHDVNRVLYVFGDKLQKEAETGLTKTHLEPDTIRQLQEADEIVNQTLLKYDLVRKLSQVPVILHPTDFGEEGKRTIVIRTFITNDFMTGVAAIPGTEYMPLEALKEMVDRIMAEVPGIARVAYDLTSKPPGTTEHE